MALFERLSAFIDVLLPPPERAVDQSGQHNRWDRSSCPARAHAQVAVCSPVVFPSPWLPESRAGQSNTLRYFPCPPTSHRVLGGTPLTGSTPAWWLQKSATSRAVPSVVGAHTQCRSLPSSMPATLRRTTGKPSICFLLAGPSLRFLSCSRNRLSEHVRPGWRFNGI
jgi:hypothetical protein